MEAHNCEKHTQPQQSSLMAEPEFIELCQIARRLAQPQRDRLSDLLMDDRLDDMAGELEQALKVFNDGSLDFETGPFGSSQASN